MDANDPQGDRGANDAQPGKRGRKSKDGQPVPEEKARKARDRGDRAAILYSDKKCLLEFEVETDAILRFLFEHKWIDRDYVKYHEHKGSNKGKATSERKDSLKPTLTKFFKGLIETGRLEPEIVLKMSELGSGPDE